MRPETWGNAFAIVRNMESAELIVQTQYLKKKWVLAWGPNLENRLRGHTLADLRHAIKYAKEERT